MAAAAACVLAAGRSPASAATERGMVAQAAATAAPVTPPCEPADVTLREVSVAGGALPQGVYALRNHGAGACRIAGRVGIRLFDAQGKPIPLRIGPNSAMPVLLTLAPSDEATFTVTYGRPGTEQCTTSARIEVYLAPQPVPVSAPTSFVGCAYPALRISNLRLGAPTRPPSALPSPLPSVSPGYFASRKRR
jgi:hypothetical protein